MASNKILDIRESVADIIRDARMKKRFTQKELADIVGLSQSTIMRIEKKVFSPNSDQLYAILVALDLPLKIGVNKIL